MKALKIYSVIATVAIIALSISIYMTSKDFNKTKKELKETEEVLQQCSDRYYQEISISK